MTRKPSIPPLRWTYFPILSAAAFLLSGAALAAEFSVKTTPCKGFVRQDGKWVSIPEIPFQKGDKISVRAVTGRQDIGYLKLDNTDYTVPIKCLNPDTAGTKTLSKPGNSTKSTQPKSHFYVYGGGLQWGETLTFTSSAGANHPLYTSQTGGALGAGYLLALGRHFDLSLELSGFFLISDATAVAPDGTVNSDLDYELSSPASVFGGRLQPGIAWHSPTRFVSVGVSIPLIYRIGNWPIPPNGTDATGNAVTYSISSLSAFAPGALLETRFRVGRFLLMPRGGFYGGLSNILFDIGLGFAL